MARKKIEVEIVADDKISADLDRIEADARALDDLTVELEVDADTSSAVSNMDDLDRKTDKSRSVMANFTGNATQDMAELGGVTGTAGLAVGQIGEYAAEGELSIGKMVAAAGPMAEVAFAIEQVKGQLAVLGAADAFDTAQVEKFSQAILDGKTALEALQEELAETGRVMVRELGESGLAQLGDKSVMKDVTREVLSVGLNAKTFSELAAGTQDLEDWGQALIDSGKNADDVRAVYIALVDARAKLNRATEETEITRQFVGTTTTTAPVVTTTTQPTVNQTIIYPPGVTPTATAVAGNLYLSRNGVRTNP